MTTVMLARRRQISTLGAVMTNAQSVAARQIARFERAQIILERYHEELRAMAPGPRRTRLLTANRAAIAELDQRAAKVRRKLPAPAKVNAS